MRRSRRRGRRDPSPRAPFGPSVTLIDGIPSRGPGRGPHVSPAVSDAFSSRVRSATNWSMRSVMKVLHVTLTGIRSGDRHPRVGAADGATAVGSTCPGRGCQPLRRLREDAWRQVGGRRGPPSRSCRPGDGVPADRRLAESAEPGASLLPAAATDLLERFPELADVEVRDVTIDGRHGGVPGRTLPRPGRGRHRVRLGARRGVHRRRS